MRPSLDVLIVGAGPGGLATAIKLQRLADAGGRELSMAVIEKATQPGYHNLSGAVVDPRPLDDLTPGWREHRQLAQRISRVEQDDLYFLSSSRAIKIPELVAPSAMDHGDDVIVSISRLVGYLATVAAEEGVEIYSGFSARQLIIEDGRSGCRRGPPGELPASRGDPCTRDRPRRRHPWRALRAAARALRCRPEPAGLLARHQGRGAVQGPAPLRRGARGPLPGLPAAPGRLRWRLHVCHGREHHRGRPDHGSRLEIWRP